MKHFGEVTVTVHPTVNCDRAPAGTPGRTSKVSVPDSAQWYKL
ncbi:hypothetical protein [Scytonema sp. PCC 10023]